VAESTAQRGCRRPRSRPAHERRCSPDAKIRSILVMSQTVVFKVSSSSGFRRFSLSSGSFSFEELQQRLASIAACPSYAVSYVDDDGDEVAIGSDSELLEAVRVMQIASPDVDTLVLRLKLSLIDGPVRLSLSFDSSQDDATQVHREADVPLPVDQPEQQPAARPPAFPMFFFAPQEQQHECSAVEDRLRRDFPAAAAPDMDVLVGMGFAESDASIALMHCADVGAALDLLLA
jgi:hypothetical protein